MAFKALLFDLDGTLLDTLEDLADSANFALRQLGCPEHPLVSYKYLVGEGVESLMQRALPPDRRDPPTMAQCVAAMRKEYSVRWSRKTRPYEGVPELLDGLTARHVPMAVLSNKPDEFTNLCVTRLLPRWRFDAVVGAKPALPKKPDPTGALQIVAQFRCSVADVLYLGDTNTDMQTAVAAGMFPVGALWGFRTRDELLAGGAKMLARNPRDVLDIIDGRLTEKTNRENPKERKPEGDHGG